MPDNQSSRENAEQQISAERETILPDETDDSIPRSAGRRRSHVPAEEAYLHPVLRRGIHNICMEVYGNYEEQ